MSTFIVTLRATTSKNPDDLEDDVFTTRVVEETPEAAEDYAVRAASRDGRTWTTVAVVHVDDADPVAKPDPKNPFPAGLPVDGPEHLGAK